MKYKETETVELKKSTSELKEAIISICAILNKHQKGKLYFGIKNDGTVVGQQITDVTLRHVSQTAAEHIEPKIYPTVTLESNEVAVFKNRIEIYNPGRFPEDYSPEDFIKGKEHSILRNPLIANALYLASDIERWGSGLRRINDECKTAGIKVEFNSIKSGFAVIFYRPDMKAKQEMVGKGGKTTVEKSSEKILAHIIEDKNASANEIAQKLRLSQRAVEKQIAKLKEKGLLRRIGPDKGGHWEVVR
mgnify:CR=1 FL=1